MRILTIGGTGFIGSFVIEKLVREGHDVTVFHRGGSAGNFPGRHIHGDRRNLADFAGEFKRIAPDVVIDFILSSERQARLDLDVFRGVAARIVALSSMDVYRACGILHRREDAPVDNSPLTEDSPLRTVFNPYGPAALAQARKMVQWIDDDYDKIPVERAIMSEAQLPGTILRLPMVYGPGDYGHRLFPILKRIDDGRPAILMEEVASRWRACRGYVENVADAIVLAAASPQATGRIYNVGETYAFSELEWTRKVAALAGWNGQVTVLRADRTPAHLKVPYNMEQHWIPDTRRIRAELGCSEVIPLDEALRRTIDWERVHPPAEIDPRQFDYEAEDAALAQLRSATAV